MKVMLVPSAVGQDAKNQYLTSYLINDTIAIDAGSIGLLPDVADQARIRSVFLSHSHIDHVASLPIFLENIYATHEDCVRVYCSRETEESLHQHLFNGVVWPDFIDLSQVLFPFLKIINIESGQPIEVHGLKITPVAVNHTVPTLSFIIEDETGAVAIVTDTGPTEEIWDRINALPSVHGVFLDVSFPDSMHELADVSKHLTPKSFCAEVKKIRSAARILVVHVKPAFQETMTTELMQLGLTNMEICVPNVVYEL